MFSASTTKRHLKINTPSKVELEGNMAQPQSPLANSLPVNAMLASSLFASLDSDQESAADLPISSRTKKRKRTGTGCVAIDGALDGGIVHGKGGMCCISGERGVGKTKVGELLIHSQFAVCRFTGIGGASCCNMMLFLMENRNLLREKLEHFRYWIEAACYFVVPLPVAKLSSLLAWCNSLKKKKKI
jgi:hypothetical protein